MKNIWNTVVKFIKGLFSKADEVTEESIDNLEDLADNTIDELKQILKDATRTVSELNGQLDKIRKDDLQKLTKAELISYANDRFDEKLSMRSRKDELIEQIISLNE